MNFPEILLWVVIFATPVMLMTGLAILFARYYGEGHG